MLLLLLGGCESGAAGTPAPREVAGTQVVMDFSRAEGLFDAPLPSPDLLRDDGTWDLAGFPGRGDVSLADAILTLVEEDTGGAGLSSPVFFRTTADPGPLPDVHASVRPDSPVFLLDIDPESPSHLTRHPIDAAYHAEGGPYGASRLLSLLPVQGFPLRPATRYAAVVLRELGDADGEPLGVSLTLAQLAAGVRPEALPGGAFSHYRMGLEALAEAGVEATRVAGLAVFSTAAPTDQANRVFEHASAEPPDAAHPVALRETFDDFCSFETRLTVPVYQRGVPPYLDGGGRWAFDASGQPVVQRAVAARAWLSLPRRPMPEAGFPLVVFVRTGGGGDRPLLDRGVRVTPGAKTEPGSGPARELARVGWAGISVDGPHGGERNVSGMDEQLLMFNLLNPAAMRDNVRQSALETALLPPWLERLRVDATGCPGVGGEVRFDLSRLTLMGHSMGATVAPLALHLQPAFRAVILSGAGASWLENVIHKRSPLVVKDLAEAMIGYRAAGHALHRHDPLLGMLQWGGDASDPLSYLRTLVREPGEGGPRHVLMLQGLLDTYILPPIANAASLAAGLDLAGEAIDATHPGAAGFAPLGDLLELGGRERVALPVRGNRGVTAVVVQHPEDGIEDGHEVVFQSEAPKRQYRCFLQTLTDAAPTVPASDGRGCDG